MRTARTLQLLLLTLAVWAGAYARTAVGPLQETLQAALAFSDNQIALLQGPALALPVVLGAIPLGLMIDRYSRVRLLLAFAALNLAGSLLTAVASSFAVLFSARCLVGLTATATLTAVLSLLADLYRPAERGRASVVVGIGQVAGNAAAFAFGGLLLTMSEGGSESWRWAMFHMTGPVLLVVLSMLALREPQRTGVAIGNSTARQGFVELWRHRALLAPLLLGLVMVGGVAEGAALIWAAPALARNFALAPDRIGALMATGLLVSGVLGASAGGVVADFCQRRGGPRWTMGVLSVLALLTMPAGLFGVMPDSTWAGILLVMLMMFGAVIGVMATTLVTIVVPNELRGLALALLLGAGTIVGIGLAPMLVSLLSNAMGGPPRIGGALALICGVSSLLGAVSFGFGRQKIECSV